MPTLFHSRDDVASARAAAIITEALCADKYDVVRSLLQSVEAGETHVPLIGISPDVAAFYSPSYVVIVCSGTENWQQMVQNFLGTSQVSVPQVPGKLHSTFASQAQAVHDLIDSRVSPLLPTRTLVLMGHSRGGAVAQILAAWWGPQAQSTVCYTFGSPRAGDFAFADAVNSYVVRYETLSDGICIIPFSQPDPREFPWYRRWFGPNALGDVWGDGGEQRSLGGDGAITPDGIRATTTDFYQNLVTANFFTHQISEYRRRLTQGKPDPFTAAQVVDPPQFNQETRAQEFDDQPPTTFIIKGASMASSLVAGTMFFKTLDRTFGWTETWYATIAQSAMIDALQAVAQYRKAFLSPDCVIYWYRASVVEIGQARQSFLFKAARPVKGTARPGGTVATDYPNSTMDCIVATLYSNQGSKRQEKFRGLPDVWLEDDDLSTSGVGALAIINSYLLQVRSQGLGMRRQTMGPGDKKGITAVDIAANGNVNLTVPLHGIVTDQPFRALIRGRDLANPMMRGTWNLQLVDANTLQCISSTRFGKGSGVAGGSVTVATYGADSLVFPPASSNIFDFNQVSTIKTGRPSDLHHGKRSAVVRHR